MVLALALVERERSLSRLVDLRDENFAEMLKSMRDVERDLANHLSCFHHTLVWFTFSRRVQRLRENLHGTVEV